MANNNNIFSDILKKETNMSAKMTDAIKWYRDRAIQSTKVSGQGVIDSLKDRQRDTTIIGKLYLMRYFPKGYKELPYWDQFPLIFPIDVHGRDLLGLNLHYLDYRMRAYFLDKLYAFANNQNMDQYTKLKLSYGLLKGATTNKYMQPTIKKYLYTHVISPFTLIQPWEWPLAIFLPLADFKKTSEKVVWDISRSIARNAGRRKPVQ
jgi:hypothetical protein